MAGLGNSHAVNGMMTGDTAVADIEDLFLKATRANSIEEIEALPLDTIAVHLQVLDDEGAAALKRFAHLRAVLHCGSSTITDAGLGIMSTISSLEALDLECSEAISDASLAGLARMPNLRWVDFSFCNRLTPSAISEFARAMPDCEVECAEAD